MTQAQLGTLLGLSQARIAHIERDPSRVSVGQLIEILRALDAELFLRVGPLPPPASSPHDLSQRPRGIW